jgi:alkylation response protein AidB-like acyl-CoA dehydrogenase
VTESTHLRDITRAFVAKHSDESAVRAAMSGADGFDSRLWQLMTEQLGAPGLLVPTEYGGAGFKLADALVILEELGRALACGPLLSSAVLAVYALSASDHADQCAAILPRIARGSCIATLAFTNSAGQWSATDEEVQAHESNDRWLLTGTRRFVLDGAVAHTILVPAQTRDGPALFAVDNGADGPRVTPLSTLDMTRRQANLTMTRVKSTVIGQVGEGNRYVRRAFCGGLAALAAEQIGGAWRDMEMSVEYAKTRYQFVSPLTTSRSTARSALPGSIPRTSTTGVRRVARRAGPTRLPLDLPPSRHLRCKPP